MSIHTKTLNDLEFQTILKRIATYCHNPLAVEKVLRLKPLENVKRLIAELHFVHEILQSYGRVNPFPIIDFQEITNEIQLLNIEESYLEADSCLKIRNLVQIANETIQFVSQRAHDFPTLIKLTSKLSVNKQIIKKIQKVFNRFGEIKDDASPFLTDIRKQIQQHLKSSSEVFRHELKKYASQEFLDEIAESVIDEKRVLAIKAPYRKRVAGILLGQSKTGSIVFIEPDSMVKLNRQLDNYREAEREEIIRILRILTNELREDIELLAKYQTLLTHLDFISAKAQYALDIQAVLPQLVETPHLDLQIAYHPILLDQNRKEGQKTIPQNIILNKAHRIIAISGPNAGGKSISLKTIGLLQIMLQAAILIPVHPNSKIGFFQTILTDIGDNQSIENHLSTYSYRLKQMRDFLHYADANTLFLIDEFGTGSDPELGGALAEVFIEDLYEKGVYGVLTTHYTNIKLKIEELPHAQNACMLFNEHTLEPLYKLEIGQAGSSFTFEVAQKNGIPFSLINRAKRKIEKDTVRLDKTMVKLQQEKFKLEKSKQKIEAITQSITAKKERLEDVNERIETKLLQYQDAFDRNQKYIQLGKKIDQLAERYFHSKQKKDMMREVLKLIEMENAKRIPIIDKEKEKKDKKIVQKITQELEQKMQHIREKRSTNESYQEELQAKELAKRLETFKIGMRVKVGEGTAIGKIEKIEKNHAFINFGFATLKTALKDLKII